MVFFLKKIKTKSDKSIPYNTPNCTVLNFFSGEHAPKPPMRSTSFQDIQIPKSEKNNYYTIPKSWGRPWTSYYLVIVKFLLSTTT